MNNDELRQSSTELVVLCSRLIREVRRHTPDLPAASTRLLSLLDELGPSTVGDLAVADRCTQPTMSGLVKGLQLKEWVSRSPHPTDARSSYIALTERGRSVLAESRLRNAEVLAARAEVHGLTSAQIEDTVALLTRLLERD